MSDYRRFYVDGGIYFFTLVTKGRRPILCTERARNRLKAAFQYTIKKYLFRIMGLVILPDHLHCIWQLPENDHDFSPRWNFIKRYFSIGMEGKLNHRREKNIWQKRFWEHLIRDEYDFYRCLEYIYYNPVKHGYVDSPHDWAYSTFKRDVQKGLYEIDWGNGTEPNKIKDLDFE
jgi:putative transposase